MDRFSFDRQGRVPTQDLTRRALLHRAGALGAAAATLAVFGPGPTRARASQGTPAASPAAGDTQSYRFAVGGFTATLVTDGTAAFPDPTGILFPTAPPDELARALRAHGAPNPWPEWVTPFTPLLVETGRERVLIDTGFGPGGAPSAGRLLTHLAALGVAPDEIDVVVLSHGHPDHIGGATDGAGEATFPNARYLMARAEWEFWTDRARIEADVAPGPFRDLQLGAAETHLPPLRDRIELIGDGAEIVPGIAAILAPGHSPGQLVVDVASAGARLLYGADTVAHPIHLEHPEWRTVFDIYHPEPSLGTRRRILNLAAESGALLSAYHIPFPGLGRVTAAGDAWRWEPVAPQP